MDICNLSEILEIALSHLQSTETRVAEGEPMAVEARVAEGEQMAMEAQVAEGELVAVEAQAAEGESVVMETQVAEGEPMAMEAQVAEGELAAMEIRVAEGEPVATETPASNGNNDSPIDLCSSVESSDDEINKQAGVEPVVAPVQHVAANTEMETIDTEQATTSSDEEIDSQASVETLLIDDQEVAASTQTVSITTEQTTTSTEEATTSTEEATSNAVMVISERNSERRPGANPVWRHYHVTPRIPVPVRAIATNVTERPATPRLINYEGARKRAKLLRNSDATEARRRVQNLYDEYFESMMPPIKGYPMFSINFRLGSTRSAQPDSRMRSTNFFPNTSIWREGEEQGDTSHVADVTFVVGAIQEQITAHKVVLAEKSTVFEALFVKMANTTSRYAAVPDIEPMIFRNLLKYIYTNEATIEPNSVLATFCAAKKYALQGLETICLDFLLTIIDGRNACPVLVQARSFNEERLISVCLREIDNHTEEVTGTLSFLDIDYETLISILERDNLNITEICLYDAVVNWSKAQCVANHYEVTLINQRRVLKNSIHYLRFPLMSLEEFANGPAQSHLLYNSEIVHIFLYLTLNNKPDTHYTITPRRGSSKPKESIMQRFTGTDSRWTYSGGSDSIGFQVDRPINITGFGLYGSLHAIIEYNAYLQLIDSTSNIVIGERKTTYGCDGSNKIYRVMFEKPVAVMANCDYIAGITLKQGGDSFFGINGRQDVTVDCTASSTTVKFHFSNTMQEDNWTTLDRGQIAQIIFHE